MNIWEMLKERVVRGKPGRTFLCNEVGWLRIPPPHKDYMLKRISEHRNFWTRGGGDRCPSSRWPATPRGHLARIAFCNRMIRESQ